MKMFQPGMRSFILKVLLAIAIVAVADQVIGAGLLYMRRHAKSGSAKTIEYTTRQCKDDVLIFGSSRAMHHYVPSIIKDSLGLSCFNCGKDGMNIFYHYGRWQLLRGHHTPKIIIYDFTYLDYDLNPDANSRFLPELRPYYDYPAIKELFMDIEPNEKYKVVSSLYRNNSKVLQLAAGFIKQEGFSDGFIPLYGNIKHIYDISFTNDIDPLKYKYLEKFIKEAQHDGIKMIFMASPYFNGSNGVCPSEIKELFKKYHVDFYDNEDLKGFTQNKKLFKHTRHLNKEGAEAYTRIVVGEIRKSLNI